MRKSLTSIILAATMIAMPVAAVAQADADRTPDALEMSIDENIATPAVPSKARTYVRTAVDQLRRMLLRSGMSVESMRDGEVLEITLSCTSLFAPGATDLKKSGTDLLKPLATVVREPSKYKVLVAVHTDDTGDTMYADSITAARANAIDDCLWTMAGERDTNVVPYGLGRDEPRVPNNSRSNREINRRVEIYIVPDDGLLEMAGVRRKK
ncbi:MAG: OmpA family protein [Bacteroidales bacterium]|nr:OmpA family protein [Bacteroidales bacterium]